MKKAIVTVGVSASGKTSWAKWFMKKNQGYMEICRDNVRRAIMAENNKPFSWKDWNWKWEKIVTERVNMMIENAAKHDYITGIIISDTNLRAKYREPLISMLYARGFKVELKFFTVDFDEALRRDAERINGVGMKVIAEQFETFEKEFPGLQPPKYHPDPTLPKAAIFDIDGTLAHMNSRSPYEWAKVGQDSVDESVRDVLWALHDAGWKILIFSGRDDVCREETERWLKIMAIDYDEFFMREKKDSRPDSIVKKEMLIDAEWNYCIKMVFDDRPRVCDMWRQQGLKVFQVGNPYIRF